jgi:uncharacterized protein (DUF1778 family)
MASTDDNARITDHLPHSIAMKLQEAAELSGVTLDQFMVQASLDKAEQIIDREKTIHFSKNDAAMFVNLLDNPSKPNTALLRAFKRFKQREFANGNQSGSTVNAARSKKI